MNLVFYNAESIHQNWKSPVIASVIIIGYNGKRYLRDCLASILDQDLPPEFYEVLYVDNHSSDDSARWVGEQFPSITVIEQDGNYGFYVAGNKAAEIAKGQHLVFVPQDTVAHRHWLSGLIRAAEEDKKVMVCTTNHIDPASPGYRTRERAKMVPYMRPPRMSKFGFVCNPKVKPFSPGRIWTIVCAGVSVLVKRDFLKETGSLFEPLVGHYAGDFEFGLRVSVSGYKVVFVPDAPIYHVGEESKSLTNLDLLVRYVHGSRDRILAYYKNMTAIEFLIFLPLLTLGLSLNAFELRTGPVQRLLMFGAGLACSPAVLIMALHRLSKFKALKQQMLRTRRVGRFWLLRHVWKNGYGVEAFG